MSKESKKKKKKKKKNKKFRPSSHTLGRKEEREP